MAQAINIIDNNRNMHSDPYGLDKNDAGFPFGNGNQLMQMSGMPMGMQGMIQDLRQNKNGGRHGSASLAQMKRQAMMP